LLLALCFCPRRGRGGQVFGFLGGGGFVCVVADVLFVERIDARGVFAGGSALLTGSPNVYVYASAEPPGLGSGCRKRPSWGTSAAGWRGSLYLATRHFAGWYMVNVLDLPSEDVAIALGHTDGGELGCKLYGHRDRERALDRVTAAYERTASFTQMRLV
jgi:hypothetical protein